MEPIRKRPGTIARRMMIYVMIIIFVSLVLGVEFLIDINDRGLYQELVAGFQKQQQGEFTEDQAMAPIEHIKRKVILLFLVQSLVTGVVLVMFMKKITIPLKRMFDITRQMAHGDFENQIPVYLNDEIGRLGWFINDVIADFGEIVGHVRIICRVSLSDLDEIRQAMEQGDTARTKATIEKVTDEIRRLENMTEGFTLHRVDLSRL